MTAAADNTFWMVYGAGQGAPTHRHPTEDLARQEAQRLARTSPGIKFYVLKSICSAVKRDVDMAETVDPIFMQQDASYRGDFR